MALNREIISGGKYLVIAHVISSIFAAITALSYSRIIGVADFAIYVLCGTFLGSLRIFSRAGANARLTTKPSLPSRNEYESALGVMLVASAITILVFALLLPLIGELAKTPDIFWPGLASALQIPFHVAALPAICRLEKALKFDCVVKIGIFSQISGITVGLSVAYASGSLWGPILGALTGEVVHFILSWTQVGLRPRMQWRSRYALKMIRFGFRQSVATALAQSRNSVFLVVVAYLFGQSAVGYIGICQRATGLIAPLRVVMSRIMLPVFAGLKSAPASLRKTLRSANELEVILSFPVFVVASYLYPVCANWLLGKDWQPSIYYFPWIAAAAVIQAVHGSELTALHAGRRYLASAIASIAISTGYCAILFVMSELSVSMPAIAAVAIWPAFLLQDHLCSKFFKLGRNRYKYYWGIAGVAGCLSSTYGSGWLLVSIVILLLTRTRILENIAPLSGR